MLVDPRNPNRLFINCYAGGNFLSEDGGVTLSVSSSGYTGAIVNNVSVSPRDWQRIYSIGISGTFRSDDSGDTWQGLDYGLAFPGAETVVAAPDGSNRVLMSDWNFGLIWLSSNGGRTWTEVFRYPGLVIGPETHQGFRAIAFAPSQPQVVYAGMRNEDVQDPKSPSFGIYKSVDGGYTWRESNDSTSAGQSINSLVVAASDAAVVYAATVLQGVLRSRDGGFSWTATNQGLASLNVHSLAIDPKNPQVLFAGLENDGLFQSTTAATTGSGAGLV